MSRILKRPMFRKGGSPNKGIMTGLVDRKQYATGIDKEELAKNVGVLEEVLRDYTPKTRVPYGAFGLDIATGTPVLEAFKKRYGQFTTADDKREAAIKGGAAKLGISKALEKKTVGTLKQGRNTSNQTLFGVAPGKTGFFSSEQLMAGQGIIQPIDTRMAFTFDAKTNTLKQEPVSEIDRRQDNEVKAKALGTQYNILGDLVGDMKTRLPTTVTGATGVGFGLVEGFADQFAQLGESFGIKDGLVIKDEGVIDQYLKDKGFTEKAQSAATMKASVINLGYALAKIAEPDNPRLSEGDIIRQLNRINFGASREVFSASLDQILKEEGIRANREIENLGFSFDDIVNPSKKKNTTGTTGTQDKDSNYNPLGFDESRLSPRAP
jgi:hypothetical protein